MGVSQAYKSSFKLKIYIVFYNNGLFIMCIYDRNFVFPEERTLQNIKFICLDLWKFVLSDPNNYFRSVTIVYIEGNLYSNQNYSKDSFNL